MELYKNEYSRGGKIHKSNYPSVSSETQTFDIKAEKRIKEESPEEMLRLGYITP